MGAAHPFVLPNAYPSLGDVDGSGNGKNVASAIAAVFFLEAKRAAAHDESRFRPGRVLVRPAAEDTLKASENRTPRPEAEVMARVPA